MREIHLNAKRRNKDADAAGMKEGENQIQRIEIPIDFIDATGGEKAKAGAELGQSAFKIQQQTGDSTCFVNYFYGNSEDESAEGKKEGVYLMAQLQGPTDARFASKQDPLRPFIQVNIKSH